MEWESCKTVFALLHAVAAVRYVLVLPVRPLTQNWFFLRSSSPLGRCGRAPSSTLQRFTGRRSSDPSSRLPLCSGLVVVGHRALCNGFSTRSSEFIRHFPTSALFQCMPRGPQPRVTSCNEALYCIPSAALLPPVRPISG